MKRHLPTFCREYSGKREKAPEKKNITFEYDAMGNRVSTSADVLEKSTYYVLDASGNTMSVYEHVVNESHASVAYYQAEKHIYGSSRLGIMNDSVSLLGSENSTYSMKLTDHVIGLRNYELSNHLGNVLSIVSDKPVPHNSAGTPDYYMADIRVAQDYSPFGVTLSGRNFKGEGNSYTTRFRLLDPRLGRWLTVDPKPDLSSSPYTSMDNNPIGLNDVLGLYTKNRAERLAARGEKHGYTTKVVANRKKEGDFGVFFEKNKHGNRHVETYYEGKFKGARHTAQVKIEPLNSVKFIKDSWNIPELGFSISDAGTIAGSVDASYGAWQGAQNFVTYITTKGLTKPIFKVNGEVRSAQAAIQLGWNNKIKVGGLGLNLINAGFGYANLRINI